ncbi:MAG: hypothetical protein GWP17_01885 [Aquificales bacterium]|nr:hypothetical protein [Aquificales bacterium]
MNGSIWCFGVIILLLTACAPTTLPPTMAPTTNAADAPALNPVTPTQESEFDTDPAATKDQPANSETESYETNSEVDGRAHVDMGEAVLIYERAEGKKGIGPSVHEWRFYGDGRIVGSDGNAWQVDPKTIESLVNEIATSGFAQLDNSYIPEDTCCDRATFVITMQAAGQTHTVETLEDADMPQSLEDNLQKINNFLMALYE